jgi:hypothetical protein
METGPNEWYKSKRERMDNNEQERSRDDVEKKRGQDTATSQLHIQPEAHHLNFWSQNSTIALISINMKLQRQELRDVIVVSPPP